MNEKRPLVVGARETDNSKEIEMEPRGGRMHFSFGTLEVFTWGDDAIHLNEKETRDLFECMAGYYKIDLTKEK